MMNHKELCDTFSGKACNCGVVDDALTLASQQIEEALAVMDAACDPCFQELFTALETIRKAKEK